MSTRPPPEDETQAQRHERQEKTVLVNLLLFPPRHVNPAKRSSVTQRLMQKELVDRQGLTSQGKRVAQEYLAERLRAIGFNAYLRLLDLCDEQENAQGELR